MSTRSLVPARSRRLVAGSVLLLAAGTLAACGGGDGSTAADPAASATPTAASSTSASAPASSTSCDYAPGGPAAKQVDPPPATPTVSGQVRGTIATSIGDLEITLDADGKPCTVGSFVSLAQQGYFDGTSCHRLVTSGILVLQCGDPTGTGTGGPGYTVPDELDGSETYPPGTLAMANTGAPNSGGSQFFIVYGDTPLPPAYAVFGTVDDAGIAAVVKAAKAGTDNSNGPGDGHPKTPVQISKVTIDQ